MEFKNYYQILGVAPGATAEEIKKAYRRLARKFHPDVSKEPDADARMSEVNEAFAVLSDPVQRHEYDQAGQRVNINHGAYSAPDRDDGFPFADSGYADAGNTEFDDLFSELFGSHSPRRRTGRTSRSRMRGKNLHAKVMLDLEDVYRGGHKTLVLSVPQMDAFGRTVLAEHTVALPIPKGVQDGQIIRLAGQGGLEGGGPPGDLMLEVHINQHPRYRVEGRDVFATLPVTPWEAALGATVQAPVPDGMVEVRIPPGSQSGRKLRLKGRGIPGILAGDLYLVIDVVLPPANSAKARALYQQMARELDFNPRKGL